MLRSIIVALALALIMPGAAMSAEDVIMIKAHGASRAKAGVGPVAFPHARHKKIYKCAACHPRIFKPEIGANVITMKQNMDKKFCGSPSCHNSPKAFPLFYCNKCHIKAGAGK